MPWFQEKIIWKVMKADLLLSKFGQHSGCIGRQELLYSFRAPEVIPTPSGVELLMCFCVMMAIVGSSLFICFPGLSFVLGF